MKLLAAVPAVSAALAACAPATRPPSGVTPEMDERAVLLAVIRPRVALAIQDSTISPSDLPTRRFLPRGRDAAIADAERRSEARAALPALLGDVPGARWVTAADRRYIDANGRERWERFQARFPAAGAVEFLSRVGFDRHRRSAAVVVAWWCGPICGGSKVVLLRRDPAGEWRIVEELPLTIS